MAKITCNGDKARGGTNRHVYAQCSQAEYIAAKLLECKGKRKRRVVVITLAPVRALSVVVDE